MWLRPWHVVVCVVRFARNGRRPDRVRVLGTFMSGMKRDG
jgi:hypothetical protein